MYLGIRIYSRTVRIALRALCPAIADCSALQFLAVNQIIFLSIWMSKSGLFIKCGTFLACAENGGPDRTRTYDPRLIKAVL
jgi:hypothetical protein